MHWPLYEGSRRALQRLLARGRGVRDEIVVAATCYPTQPEFCWAPFTELVNAVPTLERIDVAVAGGVYANDWAGRQPVYAQAKLTNHEGARAIGASFHEREAASPAMAAGEVDIAFIRYNPEHLGARRAVFPLLGTERPVPLFNFKSTLSWVAPERYAAADPDLWYPEITDYYRFALSPPEMDGVLCALDTVPQLHALIEALAEGPMDEGDQNHLIALTTLEGGGSGRIW